MDAAVQIPFDMFAALRPQRSVPAIFRTLWTCGTLEGLRRPAVAIVGTRAATAYGKSVARNFARELGCAGCCIVSGLALGIDAAAHEGALEAGAPTIGVLGGGHGRFFPRRNRGLAERMLKAGGAVLSLYAPGEIARPWQFLERNGVVAALSDAVVVIEAPARSGALNTAGWAAGRIPVFAVPGDIDRPHVAGCHALIRDGAVLAASVQHILDDLQLASEPRQPSLLPALEDPLQQRIAQTLTGGEASFEEILASANAPASQVLAALSLMELSGALEARPGQRYSLR